MIPIARSVRVIALVAASAAGWNGCHSTTGETQGGAACVSGESFRCLGDAGCEGVSRCLPDLTGFGPCTCEVDAGPGDGG